MKNLFETKQWDRDNVKLYKGMLFVNLTGERWVFVDDYIDRICIKLGYFRLEAVNDIETVYYTIEDNNTIVRRKYDDNNYKRVVHYYELFETTYSDWWNTDVVIKPKEVANVLNIATVFREKPVVNLFNNPTWNVGNNVVVVNNIMFINVTGDRWYPFSDNVSGGYSHEPGEFVYAPNICDLCKAISVNRKHKTLDVFTLYFNGKRTHDYAITQPLLVKQAQDVVKSKEWKPYHELLLEELNKDNPSTRMVSNNKIYAEYYTDDWGEPEKETIEFEKVYIKEHEDGIEVEAQVKEGFTGLWNKIRKNVLGIKTPSERFEESMEDFTWYDEDSIKKFGKDLADAMSECKEKKKKTLNEIRKEHGFPDTVARESTDDEPLTLREMVQPVLDELRDADRYSWNKYLDDFEAKWNHDMLKAHLNEKLVSDNVHAPEHYKLRGLDIEAIDVIRGALTEDEFRGFCKGNVLKYTIREGHKNGDEDLKKAKKYLEFLEKDE